MVGSNVGLINHKEELMKSRFLMAFIVMAFTCCIACGSQEISGDDVPKGAISEEELQPSKNLTEEEKKQIFDEYLRNMHAKDIMTNCGVLGCKINTDFDDQAAGEKSVTVQYFYDPDQIEDVAAFEDSIQNYILTNYPEADVVYTRGTQVKAPEDGEEFVVPDDLVQTLPADLNSNWNYVPVVPNK